MMPPSLLARYAEGLFWMARYLERVENGARLIDITQSFEAAGREAEAWAALIAINADEASYTDRHGETDAAAIKRFYLLDRANPTGIPAAIEAARTNARTLRPLISTEMWMQLNVFHRDVLSIEPTELEGDALSRLCRRIKEGVQAYDASHLFQRSSVAARFASTQGPSMAAMRASTAGLDTSSCCSAGVSSAAAARLVVL